MALDKIEAICRAWSKQLAEDMKAEIHKLVTHGGGQESDLEGSVDVPVEMLSNGNVLITLKMNRYWEVIEKGRKAGSKMPPSKPIEDWINKKGIKAQITISKPTKKRRGLTKVQRNLNQEKKVKSLAFVMRRSIGKKGIKPRPFFDKVFNQSRIDELKNMLAPVMKEEFIIELKNGSNNT